VLGDDLLGSALITGRAPARTPARSRSSPGSGRAGR
jgi:hypothetical protein